MTLKFYTSMENRLKLKARKFWELIAMCVEVTGEKLVGGTPPPSEYDFWIGLKGLNSRILCSLWIVLKGLVVHFRILNLSRFLELAWLNHEAFNNLWTMICFLLNWWPLWPNWQETTDSVIFTEETLNGKLQFLCSEKCTFTLISEAIARASCHRKSARRRY